MKTDQSDAARLDAWGRLWARLLRPVERCAVCQRVLNEGEVAGFDRSLRFCQSCADALEEETIKDQERDG